MRNELQNLRQYMRAASEPNFSVMDLGFVLLFRFAGIEGHGLERTGITTYHIGVLHQPQKNLRLP